MAFIIIGDSRIEELLEVENDEATDALQFPLTPPESFGGSNNGPMGIVAGSGIVWLSHPEKPFGRETPYSLDLVADLYARPLPRVDILYSHADGDGLLVRASCAAGAAAIVHAGTGNGSIHDETDRALEEAARGGVLIVRASRVPTGVVTEGLQEWQERGYIPAGTLSPQKARILAQLTIAAYGPNQEALAQAFKRF